jgi:hypothetical protein
MSKRGDKYKSEKHLNEINYFRYTCKNIKYLAMELELSD